MESNRTDENSQEKAKKFPWSRKHIVCATRLSAELNRMLVRASKERMQSKSAIIAEAIQKYFESK